MPNPNEVGAGWVKTAKSGVKYLSVLFNVDKFMEVTGGLTNGKANMGFFARKAEKTNPNQPDYDLIYFPPNTGAGMRQERAAAEPPKHAPVAPLTDDDIPF